jgi:formyltetrahydrofolate deformylase
MEVIITAVGPDNVRLVDPIIHFVTGEGANIAEVQMYDHDEEAVFAMLLRIQLEPDRLPMVRKALSEIGELKNLSVRVWSSEERASCPRLAICTTFRKEPPRAILEAIRADKIRALPAVMIGNRNACRGLAEEFDIEWRMVGDAEGRVQDDHLVGLFDEFDVDYVVLARYMRVLSPAVCWKFAGGRIINLHHGLLPSFPGIRPYHDAHASRMLTFGATCHFIVPELDAGNQIINQSTFTVPPGTSIEEIVQSGQRDNEPKCLVEGVRRVVGREVQLHFHRIHAR